MRNPGLPHVSPVDRIEKTLRQPVIETADDIIDLGPEGGDAGGEVIATGTPEEVAKVPGSYTGRFLRDVLPEQRAESAGRRARKREGEVGRIGEPRTYRARVRGKGGHCRRKR